MVYYLDDRGYYQLFTFAPGSTEAVSQNGLLMMRRVLYDVSWSNGIRIYSENGDVRSFDHLGRLITITNPAQPSKSVHVEYDPTSSKLPVSLSDSSGRKVRFEYDGHGQLSTLKMPGAANIFFEYDSSGNVSTAGQAGLQRRYHYEIGNSLLTGITSEDGARYATFTYDNRGRVLDSSLHGPTGLVDQTKLVYESDGKVMVETSSGDIREYHLATSGLPRITDINSNTGSLQYNYDQKGRISGESDRNGNIISYERTPSGRVVSQYFAATSPDYKRHDYTYDNDGRVVRNETFGRTGAAIARKRIDAAGYNSLGRLTGVCAYDVNSFATLGYACGSQVSAPLGVRQIHYSTCEAGPDCPVPGQVRVIDGPRTDLADIYYLYYYEDDDAGCNLGPGECNYRKGDFKAATGPLGQSSEVLSYNAAGQIVMARRADGVISTREYDSRGLLVTYIIDGGSDLEDRVTEFEYWPTGLVSSITLPNGSYTSYAYDAAHRLTDILDADGNRIHYTLNSAGNRIKEDIFDAGNTLRHSLTRTYDLLERMTSEKGASGYGPTYGYDPNGNSTSTTDALGHNNAATYDALNRLTQSLQDVGGIAASTKFKYDALDNLTEVTDPKGLKTTYTYDGFGQLKTTSSPDTGTTQRTYDEAGNLKTSTDARGVTTTYTYDALNRVTSKSYPSQGENVSYIYDTVPTACAAGEGFAIGRLNTMVDSSGRTDYCYNRFGDVVRKAQITNGQAFVVRYTYTVGGNLASVIYPDGAVADYVRDGQGRITEVGVTNGSSGRQVLLTGASYLPFGPSTGWQYGNGRALVRSFDTDYRPTAVVDSGNDLKIGLGYDSVSNITALESGNYAAALNYDNLGRLTEFRDSAANVAIEHYTYDATGNRLSFANAGATTPYGYDATSHRLTSVGSFSRSYDAVGNSISVLSGAKSYAYNQANRLSQVKLGTATVQNYAYNARGERVQRGLDTTSSTYTTYDEAGHWLGDYDSLGNATQQVVWMDDMPVGLLADGVLHYIEPDHLGTPRLVLNPLRNVPVWTWDIKGEAFGGSVPNQDPDSDGQAFVFDMRFPGQRYDAVSGLNYNYFRDYDPANGRYAQSDPIGLAGGISSYGYVGGDPIGGSDSLGLACDSRGCWNTPEEVRFAIAGDWKGYYAAACAGGDPYACRGHEVATNTGEGLRGALSFLTNKKLAASILQNQPIGCPMSVRTDMLNSNMESIRKGLVLARVDQLATATIQNPIMVTRQSISNFHQSVFTRNGASANAFGGDLWDIIKPVSTFFYDWCGAPACQ